MQSIRFTDDVDLIVQIMGRAHWMEMQAQMRLCGFSESTEDEFICRMRLGELKVDFMPDEESILGFTNRWYRSAMTSSKKVQLSDGQVIPVVNPVHFVATKLEAYLGCGNGDPLSSHDIEDMLTVVDGRPELVEEVIGSEKALADYIAEQLRGLLEMTDFEYAV